MAGMAALSHSVPFLEPNLHQKIEQEKEAKEEPTLAITSQQPNSLSSDSSGNSSLPCTPNSQLTDEDCDNLEPIKCSATHTLERDMPDFDISHLVDELKQRILDEIDRNLCLYSESDIEKCRNDRWHVERFLLRNKLQVDAAFDMMRKAMRFYHDSLASFLRPEDFPAEFYELGGIFNYEPDRKGNIMLYMRIALHKKTPDINTIIQTFIYHNIRLADELAKGKGISIVFDCTGGGLANADMDSLLMIVSTLKNYFPKGLSYFLVHELPWILKPFWHIAKTWIPEEYRQIIKFSDSKTIFEYVSKENLPDFMGGTCKREYIQVPHNCTTIEQAGKLWGIDHKVIRKVFDKFKDDLPEETVKRVSNHLDECDRVES